MMLKSVENLDALIRWYKPERTMRYLLALTLLTIALLFVSFGYMMVFILFLLMFYGMIAPLTRVSWNSLRGHLNQVAWWGAIELDSRGLMRGFRRREKDEAWSTHGELLHEISAWEPMSPTPEPGT